MKVMAVAAGGLIVAAGVLAVIEREKLRQFYEWSFHAEGELVDRQTAWLLVLAVITLLFGIGAVLVAYISFKEALRQVEEERRTLMISYIPYVRLKAGEVTQGSLAIGIVNSGGSARHCTFVIQSGERVFILRDYDIPSQSIIDEVNAPALRDVLCGNAVDAAKWRLIWASAMDARLRWWSISQRGDPIMVQTNRGSELNSELIRKANAALVDHGITGIRADKSWF